MYCKCNKGNNYKVIGECNPRKFDQTKQSAWSQITVPEILQLPECYPDIEDLERIYVDVVIESARVIETPTVTNANVEGTKITGRKLIVDGNICQTVVYTADNCEQSLHSINFKFPFCNYIVLPKDVDIENAKFCVEACIENVYAKALNPRTIFKSVTLFLLAVEATPICPATKQIGGEITNSNTTADATITIILYDGTVAIDSQQYTVPKNGGKQKYSFKALCAKDYTVKFVVPTGFTVSPAQIPYIASNLPVMNANATIS